MQEYQTGERHGQTTVFIASNTMIRPVFVGYLELLVDWEREEGLDEGEQPLRCISITRLGHCVEEPVDGERVAQTVEEGTTCLRVVVLSKVQHGQRRQQR